MADLEALRHDDVGYVKKQLLAMSDEELMEIIRGKRTLRNAPPPKKAPTAASRRKKAAAPSRSDDLLQQTKAIDPDSAAALLQLLTGKNDGK